MASEDDEANPYKDADTEDWIANCAVDAEVKDTVVGLVAVDCSNGEAEPEDPAVESAEGAAILVPLLALGLGVPAKDTAAD